MRFFELINVCWQWRELSLGSSDLATYSNIPEPRETGLGWELGNWYPHWPGFLSSSISLFAWKGWGRAGWVAGPVGSPRCVAPGAVAPYQAQLAAWPLNIRSLSYTESGLTWWWLPCSFCEAMFRRTRLIEETWKLGQNVKSILLCWQ